MKTNAQVAAAFVNGEAADSMNLHSDGNTLRSYSTPIAYWDRAGNIIVSTERHSVTTAGKHHGALTSALIAAGFESNGTRLFGLSQGRSDPSAEAHVMTAYLSAWNDRAGFREHFERRNHVTIREPFSEEAATR